MGPFAAGQVVLLPFPFSDLSRSKFRPALLLADAGRGDWIACQITRKPLRRHARRRDHRRRLCRGRPAAPELCASRQAVDRPSRSVRRQCRRRADGTSGSGARRSGPPDNGTWPIGLVADLGSLLTSRSSSPLASSRTCGASSAPQASGMVVATRPMPSPSTAWPCSPASCRRLGHPPGSLPRTITRALELPEDGGRPATPSPQPGLQPVEDAGAATRRQVRSIGSRRFVSFPSRGLASVTGSPELGRQAVSSRSPRPS